MTIEESQNLIVEEFEMFPEWLDRYNYLIELAADLPPIDPAHRTDQYVIKGCQSRVWLDAAISPETGAIHFTADSDAIITKGIISLLIRVFDGHSADEILNAELNFIQRIGLGENLSPTRANGLLAMIKQMRMFALAFKSTQQ